MFDLESHYQSRVEAALEFARRINDFDDFVDPHRLYDRYLRPGPSEYVLRKILREEKNTYILLFLISFFFLFLFLIPLSSFVYASHHSLQREEQGWKKCLGGSGYSSCLGSQCEYRRGA